MTAKSARHAFAFETGRAQVTKTGERERAEALNLAHRLEVNPDSTLGRRIERALGDIVKMFHLNIEWYAARLANEERARAKFFFISLFLLLAVPVVIALLGWFTQQGSGTPSGILAAQASALLAGLLGFYRGISAWLDKRALVGSFAQAKSALTREYYLFEDKWDEGALTLGNVDLFLHDVGALLAKGREITIAEEQRYFENLSYPTLDIGEYLKSSGADAAALIKQFMPVPSAVETQRQDSARRARVLDTLIEQYRALLTRQLADQAAASPADRTAMESTITVTRTKLRDAELERALALANATAS